MKKPISVLLLLALTLAFVLPTVWADTCTTIDAQNTCKLKPTIAAKVGYSASFTVTSTVDVTIIVSGKQTERGQIRIIIMRGTTTIQDMTGSISGMNPTYSISTGITLPPNTYTVIVTNNSKDQRTPDVTIAIRPPIVITSWGP